MERSVIFSMVRYELRLLLRSKWLINFMLFFTFLSGLTYFYGLNSVRLDPANITYGLESVNTNIETMGVNPRYYGLKEIMLDSPNIETSKETAYNRSIALLINLSLWILPIICLVLGANSIIADKESGRLSLFKTYQVSYWKYLMSKFLALVIALSIVTSISYGSFGFIFSILGKSFHSYIFQIFLSVNTLLIFVFSAAALFVGAISKTRMQGLSVALVFWSFSVFIYEFFIIAIIHWIPYAFKLHSLFFFILINPIESIRVWSISKLNAAYVFGPEFLMIQEWNEKGILTISVILSIIVLMTITIVASTQLLKKRGV